jgi:hypothetical protein
MTQFDGEWLAMQRAMPCNAQKSLLKSDSIAWSARSKSVKLRYCKLMT